MTIATKFEKDIFTILGLPLNAVRKLVITLEAGSAPKIETESEVVSDGSACLVRKRYELKEVEE